MIPAVEHMLADNADLLSHVGMAILPNVNVDERERLIDGCPWYLRKNSRGVDINRNFDADWAQVSYGYGFVSSDPDAGTYRGPGPKSEPETRATIDFLKATQPRAVLSYHALASITGANFLAAQAAETDSSYVQACTAFIEPFIRAFYTDERWGAGLHFGACAGSLPEYAYRKLGVPGFDLEWDGNPDARPSHTDNTSRSMLETYQRRHYHGLVSLLQACARK